MPAPQRWEDDNVAENMILKPGDSKSVTIRVNRADVENATGESESLQFLCNGWNHGTDKPLKLKIENSSTLLKRSITPTLDGSGWTWEKTGVGSGAATASAGRG